MPGSGQGRVEHQTRNQKATFQGPVGFVHGVQLDSEWWLKVPRLRFFDTPGNSGSLSVRKKNGAARLDPWEFFVLLALNILFLSVKKIRKFPSI